MPITTESLDVAEFSLLPSEAITSSPAPTDTARSPLFVVGLSHHTAPVELRSRAALTHAQVTELLRLSKDRDLAECVVLSTCNRTEIYASGGGPEAAVALLAEHCDLSSSELEKYLYIKHCSHAASHLFRVTSGLDSAVLGETEIVAQVKAAWNLAEEEGTTGPLVDLLVRRSLEAGKRVRHETDLCRNVTSTASLAVKMISNQLGGIPGRTLALVGAGRIARRIAREFEAAKATNVTIVSRTFQNASDLAAAHGARAIDMSELSALLVEADAVVTAVDVPHPILTAGLLEEVQAARAGRPLLVIDMGVPPNVERFSGHGTRIVDIDHLTATCESNSELRASTIPAANTILDEELTRFNKALTVQAAAPMIRALVERAEAIRVRNLDWARDQLPGLTEAELRVVEELARRLMNGMLQTPIESLKGELSGKHREVAISLFGLDEVGRDER